MSFVVLLQQMTIWLGQDSDGIVLKNLAANLMVSGTRSKSPQNDGHTWHLPKLNVKDIPWPKGREGRKGKEGGINQKAHSHSSTWVISGVTIIAHMCRPIYDGIRMSPPLNHTLSKPMPNCEETNWDSSKIVDTPLLISDVLEGDSPLRRVSAKSPQVCTKRFVRLSFGWKSNLRWFQYRLLENACLLILWLNVEYMGCSCCNRCWAWSSRYNLKASSNLL